MSASSSSVSAEDNSESISTNISCQSDSDSSGKYHELLPLDKAKSEVWKHFGFPAKDGQFIEKDKRRRTIVYCKLCPKSYIIKEIPRICWCTWSTTTMLNI